MNCPACKRDLASTLSVCPSCGTMVNDSVREELASKISPIVKSAKIEIKEKPPAAAPIAISEPIPPPSQPLAPVLSIAPPRGHTGEIFAKPTSPTLIEFQNKNAVLPEWRLELQNAVRRRNGGGAQTEPTAAAPRQTVLVSKGATALKAEVIEQPAPVTASNPTLEKALRRIEQSRQKYHTEEEPKPADLPAAPPSQQPKTFPYTIVNKTQETPAKSSNFQSGADFISKPRIATPLTDSKPEKFDTNKLPPLPAKIASNFERRPVEISLLENEIEEEENKSFAIRAVEAAEVVAYADPETEESEVEEEADDRAPVALRFNAGLFDLIIGSFISVILLAPFMLSSGNLFTIQGLIAFLATCSVVMFIYLTTTIGTMGRTYGMRIFSLELIDIEENAYPTFHQAAVSSAVYLVSLALGGMGFLTLFLNHEKRAAHDLLSGTIVVKEFE
jgi:uncharacterized RDD family membrane protein YckC